jgi:hypothetical protein
MLTWMGYAVLARRRARRHGVAHRLRGRGTFLAASCGLGRGLPRVGGRADRAFREPRHPHRCRCGGRCPRRTGGERMEGSADRVRPHAGIGVARGVSGHCVLARREPAPPTTATARLSVTHRRWRTGAGLVRLRPRGRRRCPATDRASRMGTGDRRKRSTDHRRARDRTPAGTRSAARCSGPDRGCRASRERGALVAASTSAAGDRNRLRSARRLAARPRPPRARHAASCNARARVPRHAGAGDGDGRDAFGAGPTRRGARGRTPAVGRAAAECRGGRDPSCRRDRLGARATAFHGSRRCRRRIGGGSSTRELRYTGAAAAAPGADGDTAQRGTSLDLTAQRGTEWHDPSAHSRLSAASAALTKEDVPGVADLAGKY